MTAKYEVTSSEKKFVGWHLLIAIIALTIGSLFGPLQAFEHAGLDLYPYLKPLLQSYYQGLTLHGVLNALVWTTFFITGFLNLTIIYGLKRPLRYPTLNKTGFWIMVVGLVTTAV
ncbi:MAG TPA: cbb3-type cytochrome c oxidase subunit I, partial [Anaerolineales bacterium]|nr:cbb3-type cytochrome c oxidase subunit I [Anaerolineales bacterium]